MGYKSCAVPQCTSTSKKYPDKLFIYAPTDRRRRELWLKLARRESNNVRSFYMCEDHFDMEKAISNYRMFKMGFSTKLSIADGAVPTKFHCQEESKKILSETKSSQIGFYKIESVELVPECQQNQSATETHTESLPIYEEKDEEPKELTNTNDDPIKTLDNSFEDEKPEEELTKIYEDPIRTIDTTIQVGVKSGCSICHSKRAENVLNSENFIIDEQRLSYIEIIQFCLGLQLSDVSAISTMLCKKCIGKFISFYKFKTLALKSLNLVEYKGESEECNVTVKQEQEESFEYQEVGLDLNLLEGIASEYVDVAETTTILPEVKIEDYSDDKLGIELAEVKSDSDHDPDFEIAPKSKTKVKKPCGKVTKRKRRKPKYCKDYVESVSNPKVRSRSQRILECDQCTLTFTSYYLRKKHKLEHENHITVMKQKCKICRNRVKDLEVHMLNVHNKVDLKYGCNICGHRMRTAYTLKLHKRIHTSTEKFECDVCFKTYSSKALVKYHKKNVHEKEKKHLCQYCPKAFFKKYGLNEHLRKHSNERTHVCECGKSFKMRSGLALHRKTNEGCGQRYTCDYCQQTFPIKKTLTDHIMRHMNLRPHVCRFCDLSFQRTDYLQSHEKIHLKRIILPSL